MFIRIRPDLTGDNGFIADDLFVTPPYYQCTCCMQFGLVKSYRFTWKLLFLKTIYV